MSSRRFELHRDEDVTGVSGIGVVASGVEFPDRTVVLRWQSGKPSTELWESIEAAIAVHGHGGLTRVVWQDNGSVAPPEHPNITELRAWCYMRLYDPTCGKMLRILDGYKPESASSSVNHSQ